MSWLDFNNQFTPHSRHYSQRVTGRNDSDIICVPCSVIGTYNLSGINYFYVRNTKDLRITILIKAVLEQHPNWFCMYFSHKISNRL